MDPDRIECDDEELYADSLSNYSCDEVVIDDYCSDDRNYTTSYDYFPTKHFKQLFCLVLGFGLC